MNRHTELEWQFATQDLASARNWLAAQPQNNTDSTSERRFSTRPTLNLQDTYYDSPDWLIFRAGFALRVRRASPDDGVEPANTEITLKSLHAGQDGLARRTEISENIGDTGLEEILASGQGIGSRIRELVGERPLTPLFHARTRRERRHLLEADSDLALAEVDLDETSIESPNGQGQALRRVEVECINAEPEVLTPLVEQLRDAAQLQPVEMSKFRAGLAVAGLDPAAQQALGDDSIRPAQPFADAQLALLRRYLAALLEKEAEVRGGSVAALHEMRVAARHLDVLLRMFRGFGPGWAVGSRARVRGLIKALGAVRDCDVQLVFLDSTLESLNTPEGAAFAPMRERLVAQQQTARGRLLQWLDSPGMQAWLHEWRENLRHATPGSTRAQHAITAVVARDRIRDAFRALRKRARRLDADSPADEFHEVRIRAKRLRYTLDAFAGLYGEVAGSFSQALARMQTVLGEYHDASVREQRFTALVENGPRLPSSTSFALGRLVERDVRAIEHCREQFPKAWRRVRKRRWRELNAEMKRVAQEFARQTPAQPAAPRSTETPP
jgi:CHAD domain-containing protein